MKKITFRFYLKKYAAYYVTSVVVLTVSILLDLLQPLITEHIVDDVIIGGRMELLWKLLSGIIAMGIGRCIFQYVKEFFNDYAGAKIGKEIRNLSFQKIQSLSADFFDKNNTGELMARVRDDATRVQDMFQYIGILLVEAGIRTVIALFFMYRLNWQLSIIPTLAMAGAAFVTMRMSKKLDQGYEEMAEENSVMNNVAQENIAGVRTVKAFAREKFEIEKFRKHNHKYYGMNIKQSNIFVRMNPFLQMITYLLPATMLLTGGYCAIKDIITVGELTAFVQFSTNIVWPMEMLGWLTNDFSAGRASQKRLNKIFEETPTIQDAADSKRLAEVRGDVCFDHVSYVTESGKSVLSDVSFSLPAGKTLGIMGATGSGKTTIINLLKRIYDSTDGRITLDGADIKKLPLDQLRTSVASVVQDVFLFSDTINENVKLGQKKTLSDADVLSALDAACAGDFVRSMKDGVGTVIGERGIGLSGGQKQRVTIARALSHHAPVLVLDDSTSALDTETEREFQKTLEGLTGMTKIIIAHRISAVRNADEIIVLEKGSVAERGTHKELLEKKGLYYETWCTQSGRTEQVIEKAS